MTRDPAEGVAPDGTIVTGADAANLAPPFTGIIDDALTRLRAELGANLHSVYVHGSVATGMAVVPTSDLDLAVVTRGPPSERVRELAGALSREHADLVREVALGAVDLSVIEAEDAQGAAERCFLRHYAVHLTGPDLRDGFAPCRPTGALAVGFNGNLDDVLSALRPRMAASETTSVREAAITAACRKLLLAAATLLSVDEGSWSTDRARGAELIARVEPALAEHANHAIRWVENAEAGNPDSAARNASIAAVDALGPWLVAAYGEAVR